MKIEQVLPFSRRDLFDLARRMVGRAAHGGAAARRERARPHLRDAQHARARAHGGARGAVAADPQQRERRARRGGGGRGHRARDRPRGGVPRVARPRAAGLAARSVGRARDHPPAPDARARERGDPAALPRGADREHLLRGRRPAPQHTARARDPARRRPHPRGGAAPPRAGRARGGARAAPRRGLRQSVLPVRQAAQRDPARSHGRRHRAHARDERADPRRRAARSAPPTSTGSTRCRRATAASASA